MAAEGSSSGVPHLSELRIVLLGNRESGKSSAGNTILGREEFDPDVRTLQCVKRQGEVAGRHVTVVDTPGWKDYDLILCRDTPKLLKQEILLSVTLCPPGPHAFLLVIHENMTFTEQERNATSNHLSLLGHGAWKHSLVLFIQETPAEEKTFEVKGKMLQWLVENCGNRYHVLNIKKRDDNNVLVLLKKIEEMVAVNHGDYYKIKREILQKVEEKRSREEQRVKERQTDLKQREKIRASTGPKALPNFSIVLLGSKDAGKSSSGNTILGREEFQPGQRSAVCVKRQGEVAGRQVTLVEASGWWVFLPSENSPEMVKREIMFSPSLCNQGPQAFCLVIRVDMAFTKEHRISVQQHLSLISERVWSHTIVLFTHGDWLGDTTIEQHIECEGEPLQAIVEKCGNRYHVLNNQNNHNTVLVIGLLEKIEEILERNINSSNEKNAGLYQKLEKQKKTEKISAEKRIMEVQKQRENLRTSLGHMHQSSLRIVLLGFKYSGKSSTGNTILGKDVFELCSTRKCEKRQAEVAGRQITVVTTPSWFRNTEAPLSLQQETVLSLSLCDPGPHALLLLICVDVYFSHLFRQAVQKYLALFSGDIWSHTMVLFTGGDWLGDTSIEQHIESEGESLKWLIEKCGNRYHVLNNNSRTDDQVTQLLEKIEELVAGNSGHHFEMDRKTLKEMEERKKQQMQRAEDRQMRVYRQRAPLRLSVDKSPPMTEFRLVLLGHRASGKSSSGNTILGREEFDLKRRTAQCVKRQGEVAGKQVKVVEAPGWWKNYNLKQSSEITKEEIVYSVCLCPPGPHILLLLIEVDELYGQDDIINIQEHLEFISDRVWSHTMVLFTWGDWLGDTSIEQYIESEEHLRYLVEKCGNRYHVLNNNCRTDDQVTQLLEKIEELVAGNSGHHYVMDRKRLEEMEERRKQQMQRAEDRQMRVYRQRAPLKFSVGDIPHLSEVRIVLLGYRNAGKSSSGNTILGREEFNVGTRTAQCVKRQGEVAGRHVTVVEAPGWWNNHSVKDTPKLTRRQIVHSASLCPPGPHAVLLVIRGDLPVTQQGRKNMGEHLRLVSEDLWSHTIVLFTWGDWLGDTSIEQHIESEGQALKWLIEKCGNRYHVLNNKDRADSTQVTKLLEKIEEMVVRNFKKDRMRPKETQETRVKESTVFQRIFNWWKADDPKKKINNVTKRMAERMEELDLEGSISDPPNMSDVRSDILTEGTSGYCTLTVSASQASSRRSSVTSINSESFRIRSLAPLEQRRSLSPSVDVEVDDVCNTEDREFSGDNEVFTPHILATERTTYRQDIPDGGTLCQSYSPANGCKSCEDFKDTSHWILMEPYVSMETGEPVYKHLSPPGRFECAVSGLRWVCAGDVILQYQFNDPDIFSAELAMLQYEPIGPLMDIKVLSGELLEAHLPHFACLEGSDSSLRDAVKVLHGSDSGVTLESCELTRFHAKLLRPSFSLTEVLVKIGIKKKAHLEVLIYRTRVSPLVLLTYVVPREASMIQAVKKDVSTIKNAKEIKTHRPDVSIRMYNRFSLKAQDADSSPTKKSLKNQAKISPSEITLKYIRPPDLFKVVIENATHKEDFELEIISEEQSIWKATLESFDYDDEAEGCAPNHEMPSAASIHFRDVIRREVSNTSTAAGTDEASVSNREPCSPFTTPGQDFFHKHKAALEIRLGLLAPILSELVAHDVLILQEREEVEAEKSATKQNRALLLMLERKGGLAQEEFHRVLLKCDKFLVHDLEKHHDSMTGPGK